MSSRPRHANVDALERPRHANGGGWLTGAGKRLSREFSSRGSLSTSKRRAPAAPVEHDYESVLERPAGRSSSVGTVISIEGRSHYSSDTDSSDASANMSESRRQDSLGDYTPSDPALSTCASCIHRRQAIDQDHHVIQMEMERATSAEKELGEEPRDEGEESPLPPLPEENVQSAPEMLAGAEAPPQPAAQGRSKSVIGCRSEQLPRRLLQRRMHAFDDCFDDLREQRLVLANCWISSDLLSSGADETAASAAQSAKKAFPLVAAAYAMPQGGGRNRSESNLLRRSGSESSQINDSLLSASMPKLYPEAEPTGTLRREATLKREQQPKHLGQSWGHIGQQQPAGYPQAYGLYGAGYPAAGYFGDGVYRNIYPYTTLYSRRGPFSRSTGAPAAAAPPQQQQPPTKPHAATNYSFRRAPTTTASRHNSRRYSTRRSTLRSVSTAAAARHRAKPRLYDIFADEPSSESAGDLLGSGAPVPPPPPPPPPPQPAAPTPVFIVPAGTMLGPPPPMGRGDGGWGQQQRMAPTRAEGSEASSGRKSAGRSCAVGWMLAVTAVIILALAIALFIQVSKDANELHKLRSAVAADFGLQKDAVS